MLLIAPLTLLGNWRLYKRIIAIAVLDCTCMWLLSTPVITCESCCVNAFGSSPIQSDASIADDAFYPHAPHALQLFASHVPTAVEPSYLLLTQGRNGTWLDDMVR